MLRTLLLSLALAAVALAGCSDSKGPQDDQAGPGSGLKPTETTGIIRGVAVDETIRPLAGVKVLATVSGVAREMVSDETGFFGMDGLQPGVYFLSAAKVGYDPVQQSVDVVAGEDDPPITRILLTSNPALRPFSETFVWNGFLQCSAGVPVVEASANPCYALTVASEDLSSNTWEKNITAGAMTVQAEMVWKPATAVGTSFLMSSYVPNEDLDDVDGVTDYAEAQGGSPLILRVDGELLGQNDVGTTHPLAFRVFPGQDQPTMFANQAFDVYITVFYGLEAPAGWTYIADGPWVYQEDA